MTLQQLEYIIAIENYGYFVEAAEACGVTQSTMSLMVKKLEEELDVRIFNRDTHPVSVTQIGRKVIDEAKLVVFHAKQLTELTRSEKELCSGDLNVAMITSVAPVLMAGMFKFMKLHYPDLRLQMEEMMTSTILAKLKKAEVDMGILTSPINDPDLLEIPLYHERFFAYVSPEDAMMQQDSIERDHVLDHPVWIMRDGVRLFDRSMLEPGEAFTYEKMYEGGRVGILIQITNENGGITIIPETHINLLTEPMRACLKPIVNPEPKRTICLAFRKDYIHEQIMNIVVKSIKTIIPYELWDDMIRAEHLRL
jgi:LysR family hydrogen peroxide-inducible transcriptional activator